MPVLSCVLAQITERNDRIPMDKQAVTIFHALKAPGIGVRSYMDRCLLFSFPLPLSFFLPPCTVLFVCVCVCVYVLPLSCCIFCDTGVCECVWLVVLLGKGRCEGFGSWWFRCFSFFFSQSINFSLVRRISHHFE